MRPLITLLLSLAGIYVLLSVVLYLLQNRMVFLANMPGRALTATPGDAGFAYQDVSITTSDGVRLHGWFVAANQAKATVLFLHGNAGNISHRLDSIAIFRELGLDVFIIDYRGYGQSEGKPSERGTYLDARAAWEYLVNDREIAPKKIVIFGRSLGGAVASWLAAQTTPGAVILESTFTSAPDMAHRLYPFLPVRLMTRLKYSVKENVKRLSSPLLVVHSRQDEVIPFDMGESIFAAAPEPKQMLVITGDHSGGFLLNRNEYMTVLDKLLDQYLIMD
ncbi:alpha/beta hydrolase [Pseudomonadota bacterium]